MSYDQNNVFVRILRGEIPCIKVYEDEETLAFMDLMPQLDGHVLVIPKELAETIFDLSEHGLGACMRTVRKVARAACRAMNKRGVMISQQNGIDTGQSVPHVHFHVIPRKDVEPLRAHECVREDPAQLEVFAQRIRAALNELD